MNIDVIIPAYNAHDTITRTIGSIALQSIHDDIKVTIVNDNPNGEGYNKIIDRYPELDIEEIKMPENGGPGLARQYGLDNTSNPLVTFIDADDTFAGAFSLKELRRNIETDNKCAVAIGTFIEENGDSIYVPHPNDTVWMFGKMYRRSFLQKYNIHFNSTRSNEDTGFNAICKLLANSEEQIKFIPDTVYYWHFKEDSITRINNFDYSYNASFGGYTTNMIYAINEAHKILPFAEHIDMFSVQVMCNLYGYFLETCARDRRYINQNFEHCYRFYKEIYSKIESKVNPQILGATYSECMRNYYVGNKFAGYIPEITFNEFMDKLHRYKEG